MMSEEKILPCIWCGSKNIRIAVYPFRQDLLGIMSCMGCKLQFPSIIMSSREEIEQYFVSRWNALPRKTDIEQLEKEADWLAETIEKIEYISYDYIREPEAEEWCERLIDLCLGDDDISWREAAHKAAGEQGC